LIGGGFITIPGSGPGSLAADLSVGAQLEIVPTIVGIPLTGTGSPNVSHADLDADADAVAFG
jgi:hypothetical protein